MQKGGVMNKKVMIVVLSFLVITNETQSADFRQAATAGVIAGKNVLGNLDQRAIDQLVADELLYGRPDQMNIPWGVYWFLT